MSFIKVSEEEFDAFIKGHPRKLSYDVTGICEPPLGSYNDFRTGKVWPDSVVAKVVLNEAMSGHPAYKGEPNDYYIRTGEYYARYYRKVETVLQKDSPGNYMSIYSYLFCDRCKEYLWVADVDHGVVAGAFHVDRGELFEFLEAHRGHELSYDWDGYKELEYHKFQRAEAAR